MTCFIKSLHRTSIKLSISNSVRANSDCKKARWQATDLITSANLCPKTIHTLKFSSVQSKIRTKRNNWKHMQLPDGPHHCINRGCLKPALQFIIMIACHRLLKQLGKNGGVNLWSEEETLYIWKIPFKKPSCNKSPSQIPILENWKAVITMGGLKSQLNTNWQISLPEEASPVLHYSNNNVFIYIAEWLYCV